MSKHTPGPWKVEGPTEYGRYWVRQTGLAGFSIVLIGSDDTPSHNAGANARLIAAAPDLLFALKCFRNVIAQHENPQIVDEAIAKAEGRELTCADFAESIDFTTQIDEQYWDGGVNTDQMFERLIREAKEDGVTLADSDTWDYDTYFYDLYRNTEKGLS